MTKMLPPHARVLLALSLGVSVWSPPAAAQDDDALEANAFSETVGRFSDRMKEFSVDARSIADAREAAARQRIMDSYNELQTDIETRTDEVKAEALGKFEAFLAKYPRSHYAPHVMFRLGDLYYDEAQLAWVAEDKELERLAEEDPEAAAELPLPQLDYSRSVALYERIIDEHPDYEFVDGCHYMLGYTRSDTNSEQFDEELGRDSFLTLVDAFPDSQFAADANMRLGEYFFDRNRMDDAIVHYNRVVAEGVEARLYDRGLYKLAWSHYKNSDYDRALKLLVELMDFSREQYLDTGVESPMLPEAVEYTAISISDVADRSGRRPIEVAVTFFEKVGEREYEHRIYDRLADVLTQQARYEDAIATFTYLQERWPNKAENPTYQFKVAQLYMSLPIPDPESMTTAIAKLNEDYKDGTAWRTANRNNPDALAVADKYIEDSLASVATAYHVDAQATGNVEDYGRAAELYGEYIRKFPFSDNFYEITWYYADTLAKSGRLDEALKQYEVLSNTDGHEYRDGARYELVLARREMLVQNFGKEDAVPEGAEIDKAVPLPSGGERIMYKVGEDHQAFVEVADALAESGIAGGDYAEAFEKNKPALAYISGQIYYAHGQFDEARLRFEKIIDTWPERDEAAFAASLIIDSYQEEENLAKVKLKAAEYSGRRLGESQAAEDKQRVFGDIEEGATFKLANDLAKKGDREAAADAFVEFMEAYPNSKYIKDAHFNAANNLEIIGRVDDANRLFEEYVDKWPRDDRSRAMFFRIAGNYANILELDKAVFYYDELVKNFSDSVNADAPAALYNSAFLSIGMGNHKAAALKFEQYAKKFGDQADAELVRFQAGAQWELVDKRSAIEFYGDYVRDYQKADNMNADRIMEAMYRVATLQEETGASKRVVARAWKNLADTYARLAPSGKVGASGRHYAARAAFMDIEETFDGFKVIKFTSNEEKNTDLLLNVKKNQLADLEKECLALVSNYQDFEYSSAALFIQGAAFFAYSDMLYEAPPPKSFNEEMVMLYQEKIDELRIPVEDKGRNRLTSNVTKAKEAKRWSPWITETVNLLNERYPKEFPREKEEVRGQGDSNIVPAAPALSVRPAPEETE